jgi:hypothetical protein
MIKTYYSIKETAQILGFSTNSIYKFANTGRLKGNRGKSKRGRFRFTHRALEEFAGLSLSAEYIAAILEPQTTTPKAATPESIAQNHQAQQDPTPASPAIPLHLTRSLIILSLMFIIADIFTSQNFSLLQQLIRLFLLATIIIITYQFGSPAKS